MEWTTDPATSRYTIAYGLCAATVWLSTRHGYAATVTHRGLATAQYGFITLEDVQAWSLTKLAELRANGKCASVTVPFDDDQQG